ncbi:hypothetical protein ACFFP0_17300 [Rhizobium puerariae]|uniref:Polyhydroxybutyrate depolymerase n=1 Tax=Rhizobium puerariae TaxID=1585791 RepID=A0ABV6AJ19_9HYPH
MLEIEILSTNRTITYCPPSGPAIPGYFLAQGSPMGPVLLVIHGISRNAAEMASRFAAHPAFRDHTIVAPLFEAGRFGQYQQLRAKPGQMRSDIALGNLLEHLSLISGLNVAKISLFGFSGGAQMAHRYALFYPDRVSSVLAVAAGWYTMPTTALRYPYGIGTGAPATFDVAAAMNVAVTVAVGSLDTRHDQALRRSRLIETSQGRTRLARALAWVEAMRQSASVNGRKRNVSFECLVGGTHEFGQCVRETHLMSLAVMAFSH